MARVLVTGGTGFVGSHLLEELSGKHDILAIGRTERTVVSDVKYTYLDLRDYEKAEKVIMAFKPEIIFHLAANSKESTGEHSPIDMTTNGYNTFFNTIVPAIKAKSLTKFIYVSSAAVYGNIRVPYKEHQRPEPNDIYAVSKYANELSLEILARTYGFSFVILRPHNITGERQDPRDPARNVVPMFMQLLRLGKRPKIFGDGSSVRCYTYVKDVAQALVKCLDIENETLNVGSDTATSIQTLYDTIVEVSGINVDAEYMPPRLNEVQTNTVAHTKARKLLGVQETPFKETIQKTWEWVSRQPLLPFKKLTREI